MKPGRYVSVCWRIMPSPSFVLKLKAAGFSKTLANTDQTSQLYIPGDSKLHVWERDAEEKTWTEKRESDRKL